MKAEFFSYDTVTSTNDIAIEKLHNDSEPKNKLFVVTAKHQTQGRGRNNKV